MNQLNKELINNSVNSLSESLKTSWTNGNVLEWREFATRMQRTINMVTPILTTIANNLDVRDVSIDEGDVAQLKFVYYRLTLVHGENPNIDYMIRMKKIIDKFA